jgi:flagellar L-ring protein precursor FlgH
MRWIQFIAVLFVLDLGYGQTAPGSVYQTEGRYGDLASDLRARRIGDLVTVVVSDRLNATTSGGATSERKSSARASVSALGGDRSTIGALANLAGLQGESNLDGSGSTSRSNVITTTLSGRVVDITPNGDLVIHASKEIGVNGERHSVAVRGVIRWNDLSPGNLVRSDRIALMTVSLNGKGIVSDAIRRPNLLYRILLGVLPF